MGLKHGLVVQIYFKQGLIINMWLGHGLVVKRQFKQGLIINMWLKHGLVVNIYFKQGLIINMWLKHGLVVNRYFKRALVINMWLKHGLVVTKKLLSLAMCALAQPWESFLIGLIGGLLSVCTTPLVERMKIDDPVGIIPVHLTASVWSLISVGLFLPHVSHTIRNILLYILSLS